MVRDVTQRRGDGGLGYLVRGVRGEVLGGVRLHLREGRKHLNNLGHRSPVLDELQDRRGEHRARLRLV
jgi:hypothetical protein